MKKKPYSGYTYFYVCVYIHIHTQPGIYIYAFLTDGGAIVQEGVCVCMGKSHPENKSRSSHLCRKKNDGGGEPEKINGVKKNG